MSRQHVSAVAVTYNCIETDYPVEEVLESYWSHVHEVVVVDGGSSDGTLELLQKCQKLCPIPFVIVSGPTYKTGIGNLWLQKARLEGYNKAISEWVWMIDLDEFLLTPISQGLTTDLLSVKVLHFEYDPWHFSGEYGDRQRIVRKHLEVVVTDDYVASLNVYPVQASGSIVLHYSNLRDSRSLKLKCLRILGDWHEKRDLTSERFDQWYEQRRVRVENNPGGVFEGPIPSSAKTWLMRKGWSREELDVRPV